MSGQSLQANPELRALEQFETVPAGHTGFIVTSERFAPHLKPGEIAVIDPNDKEPVSGELFAIGIESVRLGKTITRIVQTFGREEDVWENGKWVSRIGWYDRFQFIQPGQIVLSDGPMRTDGWRDRRCIGRIVGFVAPEWERP